MKRNYSAKDVASLKNSIDLIHPSHYLSKKLYYLLRKNFYEGTASMTYGALDTV